MFLFSQKKRNDVVKQITMHDLTYQQTIHGRAAVCSQQPLSIAMYESRKFKPRRMHHMEENI
jgi:hypothetical protein